MEKDSKTTVAVERTTFAKLDRLAKANSVSKMEYITHAINYFEKYRIAPQWIRKKLKTVLYGNN